MEQDGLATLAGVVLDLNARVARLETAFVALMKLTGAPAGMKNMLIADSWLHVDGIQNEAFRAAYQKWLVQWIELFGDLEHRSS